MKRIFYPGYIFLMGIMLSLGSCSYQEQPPAPLVEVISVAPSPSYVWIVGYHRYYRGGYVWVPGRYQVIPHGRHTYVQGRYLVRHGRHRYVKGYWR